MGPWYGTLVVEVVAGLSDHTVKLTPGTIFAWTEVVLYTFLRMHARHSVALFHHICSRERGLSMGLSVGPW